jgi:hypothetical protein
MKCSFSPARGRASPPAPLIAARNSAGASAPRVWRPNTLKFGIMAIGTLNKVNKGVLLSHHVGGDYDTTAAFALVRDHCDALTLVVGLVDETFK